MVFSRQKIKHLQKRNPAKFGAIEGIKLYSRYESRAQLYIAGLHGSTEAGIYGRSGEGAYSVVLSGRYDDDQDKGDTIHYTGEGGHSRDSEMQMKDQEWVRGNAALRMSFRRRFPLRVIRSSLLKSKYAPSTGYRYDGLYRVDSAEQITGKQGHAVCHFLLTRLPNQAPLPVLPLGLPGQFSSRPRTVAASTSASANPVASSAEESTNASESGKKFQESGGIKFKYEGASSTSPVRSGPISLDGSSAPPEFSSRRPHHWF